MTQFTLQLAVFLGKAFAPSLRLNAREVKERKTFKFFFEILLNALPLYSKVLEPNFLIKTKLSMNSARVKEFSKVYYAKPLK